MHCIIPLFLSLLACAKPADSPLTSTPFHQAYMDIAMVQTALDSNRLTQEIASYLVHAEVPIDHKAAVVNALGWTDGEPARLDDFCHLAYGADYASLNRDKLPAEDLMVMGYLMAMGDYFHPEKALALLYMAKRKLPKSYTLATVYALTMSQSLFDISWCEVWLVMEAVTKNKKLKMDFRKEANDIVIDYLGLYKDSCK